MGTGTGRRSKVTQLRNQFKMIKVNLDGQRDDRHSDCSSKTAADHRRRRSRVSAGAARRLGLLLGFFFRLKLIFISFEINSIVEKSNLVEKPENKDKQTTDRHMHGSSTAGPKAARCLLKSP